MDTDTEALRDRPPRDSISRSVGSEAVELRDAEDGGMPVLHGHFSVFDTWTEINSVYEGRFLERIAPTAFDKTFAENRASMRILFQHGKDPSIGDKPLAPIEDLRADETGAYYSGRLLDTSYNRDLVPGLRAGLYGASFRFSVVKEDFNRSAKRSAHNPEGLPERTVTEARVMEFGPVTFGAYPDATAGVRAAYRSDTDEYLLLRFAQEPERLAALIERVNQHGNTALPEGAGAEPHSGDGSREAEAPPATTPTRPPMPRDEFLERIGAKPKETDLPWTSRT